MSLPHAGGGGRKHSESHSETRQPKASRNKFQGPSSGGMNIGAGGPVQGRKRKLDSPPPDSPSSASPDEDSSGGDGTSCTSLQLTPSKISRHDSGGGSSLTGLPLIGGRDDASESAGSILFHHGLGDQQPPLAQSDPVSHRYVVHISDTGLLAAPTRARSATDLGSDGRVIPPSPASPAGPGGGLGVDGRGSPTAGSRRLLSHQYRFDCELGDVWTELTTSTSSGAALALATTHRAPRRSTANSSAASSTTNCVMESLEARGYTVHEQLSKGQYTSVLAAYSSLHQSKVAVKLLPPTDVKCSLVRNTAITTDWMIDLPAEVHIHQSLKHDNVVALLTHHLIDRSIAVVLEFCDNGSLRQLLSKTAGGLLTEPVSRRYFVQMFDAVSYLHASCIVHRDISVDKFLLDARDRVKLSNFGTAMPYAAGETFFTSRQGSPGYWPPEVLEHRPFNPRTADVWALGVTLHVLLTSRLPFGGDSDADVSEQRALTTMRRGLDLSASGPSRSVRLSAAVVDLLRGLLHYVTEVRFTLNRIRTCDWVNCRVGPMLRDTVPPAPNKPYIGNFYLVAKPHKFKDSPLEKVLKENFDI